jgi:hypothetical protein
MFKKNDCMGHTSEELGGKPRAAKAEPKQSHREIQKMMHMKGRLPMSPKTRLVVTTYRLMMAEKIELPMSSHSMEANKSSPIIDHTVDHSKQCKSGPCTDRSRHCSTKYKLVSGHLLRCPYGSLTMKE